MNRPKSGAMIYPVTQFKDLKVGLVELSRFIRDGQHLETGKPFRRFGGLRSRELLVNWLLCVTLNHASGSERLTFTSHPLGGDGVLFDKEAKDIWLTEHVLVPRIRDGRIVDVENLIIDAVTKKQNKGGASYASGKVLVVFLNAGTMTEWFPNRVARRLPRLDFAEVWVVGMQGIAERCYIYTVTHLDLQLGSAPSWRVRINEDFDGWTVMDVN